MHDNSQNQRQYSGGTQNSDGVIFEGLEDHVDKGSRGFNNSCIGAKCSTAPVGVFGGARYSFLEWENGYLSTGLKEFLESFIAFDL